ncbi:MAG: hypothetical protein ACXVH3_30935, partial [Solirubrobacteraceae bacterium]
HRDAATSSLRSRSHASDALADGPDGCQFLIVELEIFVSARQARQRRVAVSCQELGHVLVHVRPALAEVVDNGLAHLRALTLLSGLDQFQVQPVGLVVRQWPDVVDPADSLLRGPFDRR